MDYYQLLEHSYLIQQDVLCETAPSSRLEYLSCEIFDFTTYDSEIDELFATKAVEVCDAINNSKTFEYINKDDEQYKWFIIMCNMPFFQGKLSWGTSIRGAFWDCGKFELHSCGLYDGHEQMPMPLVFNRNEWIEFINAVVNFSKNKE